MIPTVTSKKQFQYVFGEGEKFSFPSKLGRILKVFFPKDGNGKNDQISDDLMVKIKNMALNGKDDYEIYKYIYSYISDYKNKISIIESEDEDNENVDDLLDKTDNQDMKHRAISKSSVVLSMIPTDKKISRYLDFGSSEGTVTSLIAEKYKIDKKNAIGIDVISRDNLSSGYDDNFTYIQYDGKNIPQDKIGNVDLITSIVVFHHVNPKYLDNILNELNRILKSGGILVMKEHDLTYPNINVMIDIQHTLFVLFSGNEGTIEEYHNDPNRIFEGHTGKYRSMRDWDYILKNAGFHKISNVIINNKFTKADKATTNTYYASYYKK
jgi:SAM-dependent methyltransferase